MKSAFACIQEAFLEQPWAAHLTATMRIEALIRLPNTAGGVRNRAKLAASGNQVWVEWCSPKVDARLRRGGWVMALLDLGAKASPHVCVHTLLPLTNPQSL